jgi:hypothetical protein
MLNGRLTDASRTTIATTVQIDRARDVRRSSITSRAQPASLGCATAESHEQVDAEEWDRDHPDCDGSEDGAANAESSGPAEARDSRSPVVACCRRGHDGSPCGVRPVHLLRRLKVRRLRISESRGSLGGFR